MNNADLLDCAIAAARAAGTHAFRNFERRTDAVRRFRHDVKLRLDIECQAVAEEVIRSRYPEHAVLGEEDEAARPAGPAGELEWVIDPIDGTVNFSHGFPQWCCSVAVRRGETVLAGAVFAPMLNDLYSATADGPALLNGQPIRVSDVDSLAAALVMTGLDKHPDMNLPPLSIFQALAENTQKARIMGSAALDLCLVARGAADGYFETGIYLWDVAAAGLIVQRAGGMAERLCQLPDNRIRYLASNGRLQSALREVIDRAVGHA